MIKFPGTTVQLSDTVDQYARRVHINVRNKKGTMVLRWKDKASDKSHTQRVTLDDTSGAKLLASLAVASMCALEDKEMTQERSTKFQSELVSETKRLGGLSEK